MARLRVREARPGLSSDGHHVCGMRIAHCLVDIIDFFPFILSNLANGLGPPTRLDPTLDESFGIMAHDEFEDRMRRRRLNAVTVHLERDLDLQKFH